MSTIAVPVELKNELREWGSKGESYADILARVLKKLKERQLEEFLMDDEDCIPIEQALADAKKKWRK
jgi:hypothetical protein